MTTVGDALDPAGDVLVTFFASPAGLADTAATWTGERRTADVRARARGAVGASHFAGAGLAPRILFWLWRVLWLRRGRHAGLRFGALAACL